MHAVVQSGVQGAALGDEVAGVEGLEGADHLVDEVEEDNGGKHGQRDGEKAPHRARAVHNGGLVVAVGDILDGGQKDQHGAAELPHAQSDEGAQGGFGVAQPGGVVGQAQHTEDLVDHAVGREQLLPQQGDGHAAAHEGGNVKGRAVKTGKPGGFGQNQGHQQGHCQLDGHLDEGEFKGDLEGGPEQGVLEEHFLVVVQADPLGRREDIVFGEGEVQRG